MSSVTSAKKPFWFDAEHTRIACVATLSYLGEEEIPYLVSADYDTEVGRQLYADLVAGVYGPIAEYVPDGLNNVYGDGAIVHNWPRLVYFHGGHFYEVVDQLSTWQEALVTSASASYQGLSGHLVTITSEAEFDFVSDLVARYVTTGWNNDSVWIAASDAAVEGAWEWVAGPDDGEIFWSGGSGGTAVNGAFEAWVGQEPSDEQASSGSSGYWANPEGTGSDYAFMLAYFNAENELISFWDDAYSSTQAVTTANSVVASSEGMRNAFVIEYFSSANNEPVVINPLGDVSVQEDSEFSWTIPAGAFSDTDAGDSLTYSVELADGSSIPGWLTFDGQTLSGQPDDAEVGSYEIRVTATDLVRATVSDVFTLTVNGVNDAPGFVIGDGKLSTDFAGGYDFGYSVVLQDDGKIVVAGSAYNGSNYDFALARYNTDGSLDTSFDGDGKLTTDFGGGHEHGFSVVLQGDGKILVSGYAVIDGNQDFALARYNTDGSLDTSFDGDGKLTTDLGGGDNWFGDVVLQADGKIVVTGTTGDLGNHDFALARYNTDGSLDTSFDGDGKLTTDFGGGDDWGEGVVVQADGKIVMAGTAHNGTDYHFALARYNTDGSLDTSFDGDGKLFTDFGLGNEHGHSVALQDDGKIVVAGSASGFFALARYNPDGSLDTSFDGDGKLTTDFGFGSVTGTSVVLQDDGKIVVAGYAGYADPDFALARYNADGSLDTSFDGDGKLTTDFGGGDDWGQSVTVQADGKIVVAGNTSNANGIDFALARYNPDGSLDTSFTAPDEAVSLAVSYTEGAAPVEVDTNVEIVDAELSAADNYSGASITLSREGGANAEDVFSSVNANLSALTEGAALVLNGTTVGTVTQNSGGVLSLVFNDSATQAVTNEVLSSFAYSNSSDNPPATVDLGWVFSDGNTGGQGVGGALAAMASTTISITPTNDAPVVINPLSDVSVQEESEFSWTIPAVAFADVDAGDSLTYSIDLADGSAMPGWLTFDGQTLSGQPDDAEVGSYEIRVTATDQEGATVSDVFTLTVSNVNDAPTVSTALADVQVLEESPLSWSVPAGAFADPDAGDSLTYSVELADGSAIPGWLTFDGQTLSGQPDDAEVGSYEIRVTATDQDGATVFDDFTLTVSNVNDAPTLSTALADVQALEESPLSWSVPAGAFADVDAGDSLTYSVELADGSAIPGWLTFDGQTLSGQPDDAEVGSYEIRVTATDQGGAAAFDDFTLVVNGVNDGPGFLIGDGKITTDFGSLHDSGRSVVLQDDGKIVVAGYANNGSNQYDFSDFALARYNTDGSLDTSFDGDGKLTTYFGSRHDIGRSVVLQDDGKIVVAGSANNGSDTVLSLARYNTDGSLDTSFDGDGKLTTDLGGGSSGWGNSVVLQTDGKIVVAGVASGNFALARYNTDGSLDTSFDGDGKLTTDFGSGRDDGYSVVLQDDGKIVVAGSAYNGSNYDFALARYNTDGSLDTSFDGDGKLFTDFGYGSDYGYSVVLQDDGKIVVAGYADRDFALARYNADGSLDTSFDGDGKLTTDFGYGSDYGYSVVLQADGKIVVAGQAYDGGNWDFALARYNTDGSLDTSFDGDGKLTTDFGFGGDYGYSVALQDDGKIVVAGDAYNGSNVDLALARYNADRSLDTSFGAPDEAVSLAVSYTEGAAPVEVDTNVEIVDAELSAADNYSGASITLSREGGANAEDVFSSVNGNLSALTEGAALLLNGTTVGTVLQNSGGVLKIEFNGNATQAVTNEVLSSFAYSNSSDNPPATVDLGWVFSDGNTGGQGVGGALAAMASTTISITPTNDAPVVINPLSDVSVQEESEFSWTIPAGAFADPDSGDSLTYSVELADGSAIPGWLTFDGQTLSGQPDDAEVGSYEIQVTASDGVGASVSDVFTLNVASVNDAPVGTVVVSGLPGIGELQTATHDLQDADGIAEGAIGYQWRRGVDTDGNGEISGAEWTDIPDATGSTYQLSVEDAGKYVSVLASYTDEQGTQESVQSNAVLGGWPDPEITLTQSETNVFEFTTGFTGAVLDFNYSVLVTGGRFGVVEELTSAISDIVEVGGVRNNISPPSGEFTVGGYSLDPITGVGDVAWFEVTAASGVRDIEVRIDFDEATFVGDEDPTLLESDISYTIKVGADVSVYEQDGLPLASSNRIEGDGSEGMFFSWDIELDRAVDVDHEIDWSVSGAGEFGVTAEDFAGGVLPSGTLHIAAGERTGTISFQVAGDGLVERDEGFEVTLSGTNGLNLSGVSTLGGMLLNDDKAKASIVAEAVTGAEGGVGETSTYTFEVALDQAVYAEQVVQWQLVDLVADIRGLASEDDFAGALSGEVVFAAGETSQTVTIEIAGDLEKEGRESFGIELFDPSSLLEVPTEATTVQIKDDDGYDLGGQVYFWGKGDPTKQWLMDDVAVALTGWEAPKSQDDPIWSLVEFDSVAGKAIFELQVEFQDISSIDLSFGAPQSAVFTSAMSPEWNVVQNADEQGFYLSAIWGGAANTQTADVLKLGTLECDLTQIGDSFTLSLLSGSAENDAGLVGTAALDSATYTWVAQTDVIETAGETNGSFTVDSLAESYYTIGADKGVSLQNDDGSWSKEVRALTAADARETLLISLGKEVSGEALIAADVNKSGTVTAADARDILLMSVKDQTRLEDKLDWVFVSEGADLSGLTRRDVREGEDWVQGHSLYLQDDQTSENLVAILMGDVNASYTPLIQQVPEI